MAVWRRRSRGPPETKKCEGPRGAVRTAASTMLPTWLEDELRTVALGSYLRTFSRLMQWGHVQPAAAQVARWPLLAHADAGLGACASGPRGTARGVCLLGCAQRRISRLCGMAYGKANGYATFQGASRDAAHHAARAGTCGAWTRLSLSWHGTAHQPRRVGQD